MSRLDMLLMMHAMARLSGLSTYPSGPSRVPVKEVLDPEARRTLLEERAQAKRERKAAQRLKKVRPATTTL